MTLAKRSPFFLRLLLLLVLHFTVFPLLANPPDLTNGGVPNSNLTINLGPTGMRGWVYHVNPGGNTSLSRQIQVTAVDAGSPAASILAADDVILGANGTGAAPVPFSSDARRSLGLAIADAEARNPATLALLRWRAGTTTTVQITLSHLGAYSATAPYQCPKSSQILQTGAQWVFANENSGRYSLGALTLLATGNPAYLSRARDEARALVPNATTRTQMMSDVRDASSQITWSRGHTLILLCEYYLASGTSAVTRDAQVLPGIEAFAVNIAKNSSLFGTVGHIYAEKNADGSPNGPMGGVYGPVNSAGMPCFLGLLLARKCGLTNPEIQPAINRASLFFSSYSGRGAIPYGEHEPSPSHENNGKSGLAALCFALQGERVEQGKFFAKMATAAATERESGHTGAYFNYLWAPLGAAVAGEAAAAEHFKRISWRLDLARRWTGEFVYDCLNGEGPVNGASYYDFRMSAAALLVYALPLRQLHITGRDHDPARFLSAADVAEAAAADDYVVTSRSTDQLIADTGNWSPKLRRLAAIELKARGVTTTQRTQLEAIATNATLPAHARAGACDALGRIANSASATVLAGLLKDPQNYVRYGAAEALRYLPNSARLTVLNQVLVATVDTAKPWFPIDAEDPLQFAHGRLCALLFYGGSAYGPKGIIWNNLSGVDRALLYPAIRACASSPLGFTRNHLQWTYPMLSQQDMLALSGTILDSVREFAPSDRMFAFDVRQKGFDLLEKYAIADGVPAGLKYMLEATPGERTDALRTLQRYAASYTQVTPMPDVIAAVTPYLNATGGNADQNLSVSQAAQDVLNAIAADTNPRTLTPLKRITSVVADDPEPMLPANSTVLRATAYDTAQGNGIFTWRKVSGPGQVTFSSNGTTQANNTTVQFDGTAGSYVFEVTKSDSRGLTEAYGTVPVVLTDAEGGIPPILLSMADNVAGGPVLSFSQILYTVTFDRGINPATIGPDDFTSSGSARITVQSVTPTSDPAVFQVAVRAASPGDLILSIRAGALIRDLLGARLVTTNAINDNNTIRVQSGRVTINGTAFWQASANPVTGTFNASGSDKLVVIVTGENANPGQVGDVSNVTYNGRALIKAVDRSSSSTDQTYNDIWYLDNPGNFTGTNVVSASITSRAHVTVFGLSGTKPGFGASAISAAASRSVNLTTTAANSLVIACFGLGGNGNTALTTDITTNDSPLTLVSKQHLDSRGWSGHATGYAHVSAPATAAYSFQGGNASGAHVIAAEFLAADVADPHPYLTWLAGPFAAAHTPPNADADVDRGGIATGIEWVLGGDPTDPGDDKNIAPRIDTTDAEFVTFTYRRADAAAADPNTIVKAEYSNTLTSWNHAVAGPHILITTEENGAAPGIDLVKVKIRRTLAVNDRLFLRLHVVVTTP